MLEYINTKLKSGIINLGNVVIQEDMFEKEVQDEFEKKISMVRPRLNSYTSTSAYNIEGMDFKIKITFFNGDIQSVRLFPAEDIYDNDMIDMNKYYNYVDKLKNWAVNTLGEKYIEISNRLFWKFRWGTISVPNTGSSFTGEMMQIEYGMG